MNISGEYSAWGSARALAETSGGDKILYAIIPRRCDSLIQRVRVMHSKRRYGIVILIWCATAASPAYAQRGAGVIHDIGSDAPLAGAVVTTLDSIRQPIGRVLTDAAGRYSIELPPSARQLRVVRLGYQPRIVALPRQRDALFALDISMTKVATLLSTIVVNDERLCSSDRDRAGALSLWEQARAGLLTAVVAREALPAQVTIMTYVRVLEPSGLVVRQTQEIRSGTSTRPFRAEPPAVLAQHGYVANSADSQSFHAPDADVLLDESFAATHCFSVRNADAEHPGAIGLAFEPVPGRDTLIDVNGTLWLESGIPALRTLEFFYTDRAGALKRLNAGGILRFRTMENGVAFIDDWALRLPILDTVIDKAAIRAGRVFTLPGRKLIQTSETGGVVLDATWPDGLAWQTPLEALTGGVMERESTTPYVGALVVLEATHDTLGTDSLGRFSRFPILSGRYVVRATDTTLSGYLPTASTSREVEVKAGEAPNVRLELPSRRESIRSLCNGIDGSDLTSTLLGRIVDTGGTVKIPKNVIVLAEWHQDASTTRRETQIVSVDESGRFSVCGIPRERSALLTASRDGQPFGFHVVRFSSSTALGMLEWNVDFRLVGKIVAQNSARLRGRVTRGDNNAPVAGAEVWIPAFDRRVKSDSAGAFVLDTLPVGPTLIQIRDLGFALQRDTITLAAGRETRRDYTLYSLATQLDTVRTVASATTRISPALRGFETRMASGSGGYFIPDSILRRYDNTNLGSIIMSRASGLSLVPGRAGASYLVSSRKACTGPALSSCTTPNCFVTTYIDGVRVYSGSAGEPPTDVNRVAVSELAGVEFYPGSGTGPVEYNSTGSGCGTLLLWTRER